MVAILISYYYIVGVDEDEMDKKKTIKMISIIIMIICKVRDEYKGRIRSLP